MRVGFVLVGLPGSEMDFHFVAHTAWLGAARKGAMAAIRCTSSASGVGLGGVELDRIWRKREMSFSD